LEHVALHEAELLVPERKPGRVTDKSRHLVALGEGLLDQLQTGSAGRADDEELERAILA
jgi:hypothetical protein